MSLPEGPWAVILLIAGAAALATLGLALSIRAAGVWQRQRRLARELEGVTRSDLSVGAQEVLRSASLPTTGWAGFLARLLPRGTDIAYRLQQSGLGWSVSQLVAFSVLGGSIALAVSLLLPVGTLLVAVPGLVLVGASAPYLFVLFERSRRWRAFERQLPDVAGLLGRAIRAGHPLSAGIRMVAEELPAPAADEFKQMFEETRFGLPFEESLLSLVDRIPIMDLRLMATAMLIQREVGGNLAEMLERVADTIRERFRLRKQISVLTAEARMSGVILVLLPLATALVIQLVNPSYMEPLYKEHTGRVMIGMMVVLEILGILWMRRITRVQG